MQDPETEVLANLFRRVTRVWAFLYYERTSPANARPVLTLILRNSRDGLPRSNRNRLNLSPCKTYVFKIIDNAKSIDSKSNGHNKITNKIIILILNQGYLCFEYCVVMSECEEKEMLPIKRYKNETSIQV